MTASHPPGWCSSILGSPYKYYGLCRTCGTWYLKELKRCPQCGQMLSLRPRNKNRRRKNNGNRRG